LADISKINAVLIANIAEIDDVLAANIAKVNGLVFSTAPAFTGLLDTYTGAAAAYSTRRLYGQYTGAALRVREDSGDTETDIGFDSNGDLDTAAIATHCGSANGYVTKWYGQESSGGTGSGNDAAQTTSGSQPQIYDGSAVITENGEPAIEFPALGTAHFNVPSTQWTDGQMFSSLVMTGDGDAQTYWVDGNNTVFRFFNDGTNHKLIAWPLTPIVISKGPDMGSGQLNVIGRVGTSSEGYELYENGTSVASTATYTGSMPTTSTVGYIGQNNNNTQRYNGKIQELVHWSSNQTSNQSGIEGNVNAHYQIGNFGTPTSGLLYDYSGAAAAYSVRQLANTAALAMRIREDGTDTETDIGFDSNGDLDTAAISSHCGSNNGYVVTWYDQAGSQNDATQTTSGSQPQIYNGTAVLTENGKPVLNGTHATGAGFSVSTGVSQPFTYAGTGAFLTGPGRAFGFNAQVFGAATYLRVYAGAVFEQTFNMSNRQHITVVKFDGASSDAQALTSSGSISGTGNPGTSAAFDYILHRRNTDAANQGANMQEMIFWNTGQSASNMDGIETNMDNYYSVS
jgi:hypothetical protein